jgi:hypothetical protein
MQLLLIISELVGRVLAIIKNHLNIMNKLNKLG